MSLSSRPTTVTDPLIEALKEKVGEPQFKRLVAYLLTGNSAFDLAVQLISNVAMSPGLLQSYINEVNAHEKDAVADGDIEQSYEEIYDTHIEGHEGMAIVWG